ncbi:Lrp/AsnC family leucine-responsive transcriptional regulator [Friedmanniella endophytica]|uniref:Lrp/AsnC family leucine-responsive transcriptional regulator n=1 Tax=Microlunatus kandeliicorticis TaxID=1759536 RepID=A0A7W3P6K0_9ACTN|nr:Lrp/AsnC family leucine-responsive transcriptional regulator [Microlunatus kandeliicorticis]
MESLDRQILALLAHDGRMSYTDIGRETGLSTSAAQQRVRRLEQRGVIKGYRAVIDPASIGAMLTAFVQIQPFAADQPDDTPELVSHIPQIVSCYSVAGETSYLLKVQAGNTVELEHLLAEIRAAGKVSTNTTVVLSIPYEERSMLPEPHSARLSNGRATEAEPDVAG